jgi:hypothetical protein
MATDMNFFGTNFASVQLCDATEVALPGRCREAAVDDWQAAGVVNIA